EGKVVLVTGAGSGLGEATARAFAEVGCVVACVDINGEEAERVCRDLVKQGGKAVAFFCDVSSAEKVFGVVKAVEEQFGRLDIVVNCAAVDHTVPVDKMTLEQWDQVINVNLRG